MTYYNFATQLSHFSITEWDTNFESCARIRGKYFGANQNGLYQINRSYKDDDDVAIYAIFKSGWFNLDSYAIKKLRHIDVLCEVDSDFTISAETESGKHKKLFRVPSAKKNTRIRMKEFFPSNLKGVYFQITIENLKGGWFKIFSISGSFYETAAKPPGGGGIPS